MCVGWSFAEHASWWSCMGYSTYMKLRFEVEQDCETQGTFQKQGHCFHETHPQPIMWIDHTCWNFLENPGRRGHFFARPLLGGWMPSLPVLSAWRLDAESPFRAVEPCWLAFRSKKRSCLSPATLRSICFDLIPASSIECFFTLFIHEHDCNHRRLRTPAESSEIHPHRHLRDS